ncbi:MAG: formate acetyltransferase, partial [Oscillospiraceae bacterium]
MENKFAGRPEWEGFVSGKWSDDEVNVRDFIQRNYTPYEGGEEFLAPATEATKKLWDKVLALSQKEREAGGVLNADTSIVSMLTSHGAGYID